MQSFFCVFCVFCGFPPRWQSCAQRLLVYFVYFVVSLHMLSFFEYFEYFVVSISTLTVLWRHFFYHGVTKALDTGCGVVVHFRFIADFEFRFIADFLDKSQRREE